MSESIFALCFILMRVSWLMLDGVGLLEPHEKHPFARLSLPTLQSLGVSAVYHTTSKEFVVRAIDANLGIEGLPQSGTGQTTILTGINAAAALGFHHGPWVSPSLRPILEQSVLKKIGNIRLANYYPAQYLASLEQGKRRLNAIATSAIAAGAKLEAEHGLGLSPLLRPYDASSGNPEQIKNWAYEFMHSSANITIFDLWWTDSVGHEMDLPEAQALAMRLEQFCAACLEFRQPDSLFLITSDHGNFEDLRVKTHTRNPVPLAAVGTGAEHFANVTSLTGIAAALEAVFQSR
jgi:2,3-bisphosphoglycerate-independent phosphoglycerate mutase